MALILNGTTGITVTDGSNILQDGTVTTDDLANNAVTSAKMAVGAAATNLGNYVSSFNGSTGAVTGVSTVNGSSGAVTVVSTVNGSTGAVTVQPTLVSGSNIKTVGGVSLLGSGNVDAGMQIDTNTSQSATNYAIGTYIFMVSGSAAGYALNSTRTPQLFTTSNRQAIFQDSSDTISTGSNISGTWRVRGGFKTSGDLSTIGSSSPWYGGWGGNLVLMQRIA